MKKIINTLLIGFSLTSLMQTAQANSNQLGYQIDKLEEEIEELEELEKSIYKENIERHSQLIINLANKSDKILQDYQKSILIEAKHNFHKSLEYDELLNQTKDFVSTNKFSRALNNIAGALLDMKRILLAKEHFNVAINRYDRSSKNNDILTTYNPNDYYNVSHVYDYFLDKTYKAYDKLEKIYLAKYAANSKTNKIENTDYNHLDNVFSKTSILNSVNENYKTTLLLIKNANKAVLNGYEILNNVPEELKENISDTIKHLSKTLNDLHSYTMKIMVENDRKYANEMEVASNMLIKGSKGENTQKTIPVSILNLHKTRSSIRQTLNDIRSINDEGYIMGSNADASSYAQYFCNRYFLGKDKESQIQDLPANECANDFIKPKFASIYPKEYKELMGRGSARHKAKEKLNTVSIGLDDLTAPVYLSAITFKTLYSNILYHSIANNSTIRYEIMLAMTKAAKLTEKNMAEQAKHQEIQDYYAKELGNIFTAMSPTRYLLKTASDLYDEEVTYETWIKAMEKVNKQNINSARKMVLSSAYAQRNFLMENINNIQIKQIKEEQRKNEQTKNEQTKDTQDKVDENTIFEQKCQLTEDMSSLSGYAILTRSQRNQRMNNKGAEKEVDFTTYMCSVAHFDISEDAGSVRDINSVIGFIYKEQSLEEDILLTNQDTDLQDGIIESYNRMDELNFKAKNSFFKRFGFNSIRLKEKHNHKIGDDYHHIDINNK